MKNFINTIKSNLLLNQQIIWMTFFILAIFFLLPSNIYANEPESVIMFGLCKVIIMMKDITFVVAVSGSIGIIIIVMTARMEMKSGLMGIAGIIIIVQIPPTIDFITGLSGDKGTVKFMERCEATATQVKPTPKPKEKTD